MRVPNELLRFNATVEDYVGPGALGPVYGHSRVVKASVQTTHMLVSTAPGYTVTIDALVIVRPEVGPVRPESRVTVRGTLYHVVRCYAMPDERRPSHYELHLARFASLGGGTGSGSGS